jgi:hypothetical protein
VESVGEESVAFQGDSATWLCGAMTYTSVQGRETDKTLAPHDCGSLHFTLRHLHVGLSRAKEPASANVA